MIESFGDDEALIRGTGLAVSGDVLGGAERLDCGRRHGVQHVQVAGQHIRVGGILVGVHAEFDAAVLHRAAAFVIRVLHHRDALADIPGLELVRAIADGVLAERLDVLVCH